jgi:hydrogenase nickel incorporation protein HypB
MTEGSDKPWKYPLAFEKTDLIVVNKSDLEPQLEFDRDFFLKGIRALNRRAPVLFVSAKSGDGLPAAAAWVVSLSAALPQTKAPQ